MYIWPTKSTTTSLQMRIKLKSKLKNPHVPRQCVGVLLVLIIIGVEVGEYLSQKQQQKYHLTMTVLKLR